MSAYAATIETNGPVCLHKITDMQEAAWSKW